MLARRHAPRAAAAAADTHTRRRTSPAALAAALGASPARSSAAWDADGGGDDQALSYDQAYRDMFFIGDVTADLGRVVREAPRVLFRGCGRVNHARKERARELARASQGTSDPRLNDLPTHDEDARTCDASTLLTGGVSEGRTFSY